MTVKSPTCFWELHWILSIFHNFFNKKCTNRLKDHRIICLPEGGIWEITYSVLLPIFTHTFHLQKRKMSIFVLTNYLFLWGIFLCIAFLFFGRHLGGCLKDREEHYSKVVKISVSNIKKVIKHLAILKRQVPASQGTTAKQMRESMQISEAASDPELNKCCSLPWPSLLITLQTNQDQLLHCPSLTVFLYHNVITFVQVETISVCEAERTADRTSI